MTSAARSLPSGALRFPPEPEEEWVVHPPGEAPADALERLDELYRSTFSTLDFFEIFHGIDRPGAVVVGPARSPRQVFCYEVAGSTVRVLNEICRIEADDLVRCATLLLAAHPKAKRVRYMNVSSALPPDDPAPCWRLPGGADYHVHLPSTYDEYLAMLGASTRRNLKYWLNRLRRAHPEARFESLPGTALTPELVRTMSGWKGERMRAKGHRSSMDATFEVRIRELVRRRGSICLVRFGDEVVAGTICARAAARHEFFYVVAHDPRHEALRLGHLCVQHMIRTALEQGCETVHLLWGEFDYKERFLGKKVEQYELYFYRSQFDRWRDPRVLSMLAHRRIRARLLREVRRQKARWAGGRAAPDQPARKRSDGAAKSE